MCGRFVRDASVQEIAETFHIEEPPFDLPPGYNIAPTQEVPVVLDGKPRRLTLCRWGFIPSWSKDASVGSRMINARAETVADKASFRRSFVSRRVLIPASGFYEWKKEGGRKIPFYIHCTSRRVFGFAGLYNLWQSPEGSGICTCTIITTNANSLLQPIHNRMPVIIRREDEDRWLDTPEEDAKTLMPLLAPYPAEEMDFYPVSSLVNSPRNDFPECIRKKN